MSRIREVREAKGIRKEELAAMSGLSFSLVSSVERGDHTPSLKNSRRLAEALGVSVDDLFPPAESAEVGA